MASVPKRPVRIGAIIELHSRASAGASPGRTQPAKPAKAKREESATSTSKARSKGRAGLDGPSSRRLLAPEPAVHLRSGYGCRAPARPYAIANTLNAFYVSKAGPRRLAASVQSRFTAGKGRPAEKHPAPQIEGGLRQMEGLELRLSGLSGGKYVMPGRGARLDANGGVSRGQIQQILSQLNMMRDPSQNMGDKKSRQLQKKGLIAKGQCASYFLVRSKQTNKRPLGIWELQGPNNVQPVLVFTPKTPNYKKRFDPEQIVMSSADHHMAKALERAFKHELATSK